MSWHAWCLDCKDMYVDTVKKLAKIAKHMVTERACTCLNLLAYIVPERRKVDSVGEPNHGRG